MSPFDSSTGQFGHVELTPASGPSDVKWIRPGGQAYLPPSLSKSMHTERSEQVNALVVFVLTLACTALAVFDLFLLAVGS
jgi:hypothetical protein